MGKLVTVLLLIALILTVFVIWGGQPAGTAGIIVKHNGSPINNLLVTVHFGIDHPTDNDHVWGTYTTDGTGSVSLPINNVQLLMYHAFLYSFTFDGSTYAFSGPTTQIITVSV